MVLHIGGDVMLRLCDVVAIIDSDLIATSREMRRYMNGCIKNGQVVVDSDDEESKSYIVTAPPAKKGVKGESVQTDQTIYASPISSATLLKRSKFLRLVEQQESAISRKAKKPSK